MDALISNDSPTAEADKMKELRQLMLQTLDKQGVLSSVRATLRASVFTALHQQTSNDSTEGASSQPVPAQLAALKHHAQGALALALVQELLQAAGCTHTLQVLSHEAAPAFGANLLPQLSKESLQEALPALSLNNLQNTSNSTSEARLPLLVDLLVAASNAQAFSQPAPPATATDAAIATAAAQAPAAAPLDPASRPMHNNAAATSMNAPGAPKNRGSLLQGLFPQLARDQDTGTEEVKGEIVEASDVAEANASPTNNRSGDSRGQGAATSSSSSRHNGEHTGDVMTSELHLGVIEARDEPARGSEDIEMADTFEFSERRLTSTLEEQNPISGTTTGSNNPMSSVHADDDDAADAAHVKAFFGTGNHREDEVEGGEGGEQGHQVEEPPLSPNFASNPTNCNNFNTYNSSSALLGALSPIPPFRGGGTASDDTQAQGGADTTATTSAAAATLPPTSVAPVSAAATAAPEPGATTVEGAAPVTTTATATATAAGEANHRTTSKGRPGSTEDLITSTSADDDDDEDNNPDDQSMSGFSEAGYSVTTDDESVASAGMYVIAGIASPKPAAPGTTSTTNYTNHKNPTAAAAAAAAGGTTTAAADASTAAAAAAAAASGGGEMLPPVPPTPARAEAVAAAKQQQQQLEQEEEEEDQQVPLSQPPIAPKLSAAAEAKDSTAGLPSSSSSASSHSSAGSGNSTRGSTANSPGRTSYSNSVENAVGNGPVGSVPPSSSRSIEVPPAFDTNPGAAEEAPGPCSDYKIDMEAAAFGQCACGSPRNSHAQFAPSGYPLSTSPSKVKEHQRRLSLEKKREGASPVQSPPHKSSASSTSSSSSSTTGPQEEVGRGGLNEPRSGGSVSSSSSGGSVSSGSGAGMQWVCAVCKRSNEGAAKACNVCASARSYAPREKSPLRQLPPQLSTAAEGAKEGEGSSSASSASTSNSASESTQKMSNKDAVAALMASHGHSRKAF